MVDRERPITTPRPPDPEGPGDGVTVPRPINAGPQEPQVTVPRPPQGPTDEVTIPTPVAELLEPDRRTLDAIVERIKGRRPTPRQARRIPAPDNR